MNILHIGYIADLPQSGVSVIVPKLLQHQSGFANVSLLNINSFVPDNSKKYYKTYSYKEYMKVSDLNKLLYKQDLIVFHEIYRKEYIRLYRQIRKDKKQYVIIPHGSLTHTAQREKRIKKFVGNMVGFRSYVLAATAVQFLSNREMHESRKWYKRYIIQGNGADKHTRHKSMFSKNGLKLIFIGRLDIKIKGLDILISVMDSLRRINTDNDITLEIIGPDSTDTKKDVQKLIDSKGLQGLIAVKGAVYGIGKTNMLMQADCFIQLSRTEGQPVGILDAMALGIPSIASVGTGLAEIMRKTGTGIVAAETPQGISEQLIELRDHKVDLEEVSRKSWRYINKELDWSKISQDTIRQYVYIINSQYDGIENSK